MTTSASKGLAGGILGLLLLALVLNVVPKVPALMARSVAAACLAVVGLALAIESSWGDFVIFGDVQFPLPGFVMACIATAAGLAAWTGSAVLEARRSRPRPSVDPTV
jgi:peptidoglycan/LPS O-acetylase OafA/YrhL